MWSWIWQDVGRSRRRVSVGTLAAEQTGKIWVLVEACNGAADLVTVDRERPKQSVSSLSRSLLVRPTFTHCKCLSLVKKSGARSPVSKSGARLIYLVRKLYKLDNTQVHGFWWDSPISGVLGEVNDITVRPFSITSEKSRWLGEVSEDWRKVYVIPISRRARKKARETTGWPDSSPSRRGW